MTPLAIDLFCGLGGWTEGLLAEGYRVVGVDNERHRYPKPRYSSEQAIKLPGNGSGDWKDRPRGRYAHEPVECLSNEWVQYPAQLVIQDVLTLHGAQFKDAALIVASPPCQAYSYRAMPWKKAKALPPPDNALFEACFRIQREACEAAGRHIPLVVENVCGAQKWVGRARWHYGSFYLWGDVPALMPIVRKSAKLPGFRFDGHGGSFQTASVVASRATKNEGGSWFAVAHNTTSGHGRNPDGRLKRHNPARDGVKGSIGYERDHPQAFGWAKPGTSSHSSARKAASAHIAKIPLPLARHIARAWHPAPITVPAEGAGSAIEGS